MEDNNSLSEQFSNSAQQFWDTVGGYLPRIFTALVLLVLALVVAKLIQSIVVKALELVGVNKLTKNKKITDTLKVSEVNVDVVGVTGRISFWVVIIIFALTIADVLELTAMRDVISGLVNYLPKVLAAVIVLTVTIAGASLVRDVVAASLARMQVTFARNLSKVSFYVLVIFGSLMALNQLGFDTSILTANITIIVAGIVLAFALAFGLGGRDVASQIVGEAYKNFKSSNKK